MAPVRVRSTGVDWDAAVRPELGPELQSTRLLPDPAALPR